jgi:hypothetical protein
LNFLNSRAKTTGECLLIRADVDPRGVVFADEAVADEELESEIGERKFVVPVEELLVGDV